VDVKKTFDGVLAKGSLRNASQLDSSGRLLRSPPR
jgi:hypothetical protein